MENRELECGTCPVAERGLRVRVRWLLTSPSSVAVQSDIPCGQRQARSWDSARREGLSPITHHGPVQALSSNRRGVRDEETESGPREAWN